MTFWKQESQFQPIGLKREYVRVTKNLSTALLLSQLVYWFKPSKTGKSKLSILREDRLWLAKTKNEWFEECGLSEKMCRNATQELVDLGVLEVRFWKYGNTPMNHYWLNTEALLQLIAFYSFDPALSAPSTLPFGHPPPLPLGNLTPCPLATLDPALWATSLYTEITTETTDIDYIQGAASSTGSTGTENQNSHKGKSLKQLESETEANMEKVMKGVGSAKLAGATAADVMNKLKGKKAAPPDPDDNMTRRWMKEVSGITGKKCDEPTLKVKGQLGHIAKKIGLQQGLAVITFAVRTWGKFCERVRLDKGLTGSPEQPFPGFLLEHHDIALQMLAKASEALVESPGFTITESGWGTGWQAGETHVFPAPETDPQTDPALKATSEVQLQSIAAAPKLEGEALAAHLKDLSDL